MTPRFKLWFGATRPFSFTASIVPVVVGTLVAAPKHFNPFYFLLALLGSVFIHAGTNLVNDYYDHVKGVDGPDSLGPSKVIQRGLMRPRDVLLLGVASFVAGHCAGWRWWRWWGCRCSVSAWQAWPRASFILARRSRWPTSPWAS
jgi:1,4-dihydroxy-2-naphthoate octaprenyltransferase